MNLEKYLHYQQVKMRNKNTSQLKRYYLLIKTQRKIELDLLIIYLEMNQKKEKTTDEHEEKQV